MAPAVIETLLRTRPAGWFSDWDETILLAVAQGLEDGGANRAAIPAIGSTASMSRCCWPIRWAGICRWWRDCSTSVRWP
jgi:hypothetical protein